MRLRLTFSKGGALRYTGHLDLHKIWERGLRRAKLPLAYSQGYHPKPRLNLAAALPLGFASRAEVLDVWFHEVFDLKSLPDRLHKALPPGLEISKVERVDERAPSLQTQVLSAEYRVEITEAAAGSGLNERVATVLGSESLPRERRGKAYDLSPLIEDLKVVDGTALFMRLAAREGATGRPDELLDELNLPLEVCRIERTALILKDEDQK